MANELYYKNGESADGRQPVAESSVTNDDIITLNANTSGINTGDEDTVSIQTKRPLKTVGGQSLEGTGNVPVGGTTAGQIGFSWFTSDTIVLSSGTYYETNQTNKGVGTSIEQQVSVTAGNTSFFAQDLISDQYFGGELDAGFYKGFLTINATNVVGGLFDYGDELYLCDENGVPVNSGITGAPVGDLGVQVITIARSDDEGVSLVGSKGIINITATVEENLVIPEGYRLRHHIFATKVSGILASTLSVYYGNDESSYLELPLPSFTSDILNDDFEEFPTEATQYDINRWLKANGGGDIPVAEPNVLGGVYYEYEPSSNSMKISNYPLS